MESPVLKALMCRKTSSRYHETDGPVFFPFVCNIQRRSVQTSPGYHPVRELIGPGMVMWSIWAQWFLSLGILALVDEAIWCQTWDLGFTSHGESCCVLREWSQRSERTKDEVQRIGWCTYSRFYGIREPSALYHSDGLVSSSLDSNSESFLQVPLRQFELGSITCK